MENNNFDNAPENQNEVNFGTDEGITIVEAKQENKNKLPIILIICVLFVALIAGIMLFVFKSQEPEKQPEINVTEEASDEEHNPLNDFINDAMQEAITDKNGNEISREEYITQIQQQLQEATTVLNQYVGSSSPNEIVEPTTNATNKPAEKPAEQPKNEKVEAQIAAFFNRSCYIQGALYSGGTGDPLCMSLDGDNFEVLSNLDGTEISILKLDGNMYLKRAAMKQYIELTDAFFDAMGIDANFNFSFSDKSYDDMKSNLIGVRAVTVNGTDGVCYEYSSKDQIIKFYGANDTLKQLEIYDADGSLVSQIAIDIFSQSIPADQLTIKGFEKTGMGTIFADMM